MSDTTDRLLTKANGSEVQMRRPLWLLDVDGVINAVCHSVPDGYERRVINGFKITWPVEIVARMKQLHETSAAEIRWLTTWCEDAANMIAPALGLPLDCVVEGSDDHKARLSGWWKSYAAKRLSDADPDRALIWTDDDLTDAERKGEVDWLRERTGPTLAIAPDWRCGLTPKLMRRIESFIDRDRLPRNPLLGQTVDDIPARPL